MQHLQEMHLSSSIFSLSRYGINTSVRIGSGIMLEELEALSGHDTYIAVSGKVLSLHNELSQWLSNNRRVHYSPVDDGERCKSLSSYEGMVSSLLSLGFPRGGTIAYIGGGTLGDLAGFVSATYKRGTGFFAFPTTLLSSVDSSIGGKNALNFDSLKNAVGTIWNPSRIIIDLDFLATLPRDELLNGVSEIVKYAILKDPELLDERGFLNLVKNDHSGSAEIVERSIRIKAGFISGDIDDRGSTRIFLNFGHTFGHALEAVSQNAIPHGRGVAAGMIFETKLACDLGLCGENTLHRVVSMIRDSGLDLPGLENVDPTMMMRYVLNDKKSRDGILVIPYPVRPGKMDLAEVRQETFEKSLKEFIVSGYGPI